MITFEHPLFLLLLGALFLLPRALRWFSSRRSWKLPPFSSLAIACQMKRGARLLGGAPRYLILATWVLGVVALANPQGDIMVKKQIDRGYRISLTFDVSGSMSGAPLDIAKQSAIELIEKRRTDVFAVIPFNDRALFPDSVPFTTDRDLVKQTVNKMSVSGSTALGDGFLGAIWLVFADIYMVNELEKDGATLPSYDECFKAIGANSGSDLDRLTRSIAETFGHIDGAFVVAVTDAESNAGLDPVAVVSFAGRLGLPLYVIHIGSSENAPLAEAIREHGGDYFLANSPEQIREMYRTIDKLRPAITNIVFLPERKSYRPLVFLVMCFSLLGALLTRSSYMLIE